MASNYGRQNYIDSIAGYAKLYENAVAPVGIINTDKTFAGWQKLVAKAREGILAVMKEHEKKKESIEKTYRPDAAKSQLDPYVKELNAVVHVAVADLTDLAQEVIEAKRAQFQKSLGAPSDEAIRLLTALSFRNDITPVEAGSLAKKLSGNLTAMKAFRNIVEKSGLRFPELPTEESFEQELDQARAYCMNMLDSIAKPERDLTYDERCFFSVSRGGWAASKFENLDSNGFMAAQIEQETPKSAAESNKADDMGKSSESKPSPSEPIKSGYNAVQVYIQGHESLPVMAQQFRVSVDEIKRCNPDVDLDKHLYNGMKIVVPATHLKYSSEEGAVHPDACIAVHYEPPQAKVYSEGQEISVEDL